ncbi:MAG TPA: polysaccharide pyruvyl transferase family protein [Pseudonocardiaceae bacterium]|nr:polysaccharide pyruvyl transferase family protein [Pseudonocardiaceae bacterium]
MASLIYLVGTCGVPNYGDELITGMWLRHLARHRPDAEVIVDCQVPGSATLLLGDLHPHVRFVDTLWRLCAAAPVDEPWEVANWVRRAVDDPTRAPRWTAGIDKLNAADVVHVLGGGYLNDNWPRHVGLFAGAAEMGRRGATVALTGQGMFPTDERMLPLFGLLGAHFDVLDVRDAASADLLHRGGAEHAQATVDDAFLGLGPDIYRDVDDLPEIMLCLQSDLLAMDRTTLAGYVVRTLRAWGITGEQIGVVEAIPGEDSEIYRLLELDLPGVRHYPFAGVWTNGMPARAGQTWLSTRFHAHLTAAAVGASGVAVAVNPDYYLTKHRSLTSLGSRWTLASTLDIPERPTQGGFAPEVVAAATETKLRVAESIYPQ